MKLNERQKQALSKLLSASKHPVSVLQGKMPDKHIAISKLSRNIGPVLVITDRGSVKTISQQYFRSLGEEEEGTLYQIRTVGGTKGTHQINPAVVVIDVRTENLPQAASAAKEAVKEACIPIMIWDYDEQLPEGKLPIIKI